MKKLKPLHQILTESQDYTFDCHGHLRVSGVMVDRCQLEDFGKNFNDLSWFSGKPLPSWFEPEQEEVTKDGICRFCNGDHGGHFGTCPKNIIPRKPKRTVTAYAYWREDMVPHRKKLIWTATELDKEELNFELMNLGPMTRAPEWDQTREVE